MPEGNVEGNVPEGAEPAGVEPNGAQPEPAPVPAAPAAEGTPGDALTQENIGTKIPVNDLYIMVAGLDKSYGIIVEEIYEFVTRVLKREVKGLYVKEDEVELDKLSGLIARINEERNPVAASGKTAQEKPSNVVFYKNVFEVMASKDKEPYSKINLIINTAPENGISPDVLLLCQAFKGTHYLSFPAENITAMINKQIERTRRDKAVEEAKAALGDLPTEFGNTDLYEDFLDELEKMFADGKKKESEVKYTTEQLSKINQAINILKGASIGKKNKDVGKTRLTPKAKEEKKSVLPEGVTKESLQSEIAELKKQIDASETAIKDGEKSDKLQEELAEKKTELKRLLKEVGVDDYKGDFSDLENMLQEFRSKLTDEIDKLQKSLDIKQGGALGAAALSPHPAVAEAAKRKEDLAIAETRLKKLDSKNDEIVTKLKEYKVVEEKIANDNSVKVVLEALDGIKEGTDLEKISNLLDDASKNFTETQKNVLRRKKIELQQKALEEKTKLLEAAQKEGDGGEEKEEYKEEGFVLRAEKVFDFQAIYSKTDDAVKAANGKEEVKAQVLALQRDVYLVGAMALAIKGLFEASEKMSPKEFKQLYEKHVLTTEANVNALLSGAKDPASLKSRIEGEPNSIVKQLLAYIGDGYFPPYKGGTSLYSNPAYKKIMKYLANNEYLATLTKGAGRKLDSDLVELLTTLGEGEYYQPYNKRVRDAYTYQMLSMILSKGTTGGNDAELDIDLVKGFMSLVDKEPKDQKEFDELVYGFTKFRDSFQEFQGLKDKVSSDPFKKFKPLVVQYLKLKVMKHGLDFLKREIETRVKGVTSKDVYFQPIFVPYDFNNSNIDTNVNNDTATEAVYRVRKELFKLLGEKDASKGLGLCFRLSFGVFSEPTKDLKEIIKYCRYDKIFSTEEERERIIRYIALYVLCKVFKNKSGNDMGEFIETNKKKILLPSPIAEAQAAEDQLAHIAINKEAPLDYNSALVNGLNSIIKDNLRAMYNNYYKGRIADVKSKWWKIFSSHPVYKNPCDYIVPYYYYPTKSEKDLSTPAVKTSPQGGSNDALKESIQAKVKSSESFNAFYHVFIDDVLKIVRDTFVKEAGITIFNPSESPLVYMASALQKHYNGTSAGQGNLGKFVSNLGKIDKKLDDVYKNLTAKDLKGIDMDDSVTAVLKEDMFFYLLFLDDYMVDSPNFIAKMWKGKNLHEFIKMFETYSKGALDKKCDGDREIIYKLYQRYVKEVASEEKVMAKLQFAIDASTDLAHFESGYESKKEEVKKTIELFKKREDVQPYVDMLSLLTIDKNDLLALIKGEEAKDEVRKAEKNVLAMGGKRGGAGLDREAIKGKVSNTGRLFKKLKVAVTGAGVSGAPAVLFGQDANMQQDVYNALEKRLEELEKLKKFQGQSTIIDNAISNLEIGDTVSAIKREDLVQAYKGMLADNPVFSKMIGGDPMAVQKTFANTTTLSPLFAQINQVKSDIGIPPAPAPPPSTEKPKEGPEAPAPEKPAPPPAADKPEAPASSQETPATAPPPSPAPSPAPQPLAPPPTQAAPNQAVGVAGQVGVGSASSGVFMTPNKWESNQGTCTSAAGQAMGAVNAYNDQIKTKMQKRIRDNLDFFEDFIKFMKEKGDAWTKDVNDVGTREYPDIRTKVMRYDTTPPPPEDERAAIRNSIKRYYNKFLDLVAAKTTNHFLFVKHFYIKDARKKVREIDDYVQKYSNVAPETAHLIPPGFAEVAQRYEALKKQFEANTDLFFTSMAKALADYASVANLGPLDDDPKLKLVTRMEEIDSNINKYKMKIKSYYTLNYGMSDIVFDTQFIVMYLIKGIRIGFAYLALFLATKVFTPIYEEAVYDKKENPPSLFIYLLIFIGFDLAFNVFIIVVLFLLKFLFKTDDNAFAIDKYLFGKYFTDYFLSMIFLFAICMLVANVIMSKKYFKYKYEGLRAVRAYQDVVFYVAAMLFVFPYFLIL